jgi:hypothetical protein
MRKRLSFIDLTGSLFLLAGCGDEASERTDQGTYDDGARPAEDIDQDPTPQTGTGGPSQSATGGQTSQRQESVLNWTLLTRDEETAVFPLEAIDAFASIKDIYSDHNRSGILFFGINAGQLANSVPGNRRPSADGSLGTAFGAPEGSFWKTAPIVSIKSLRGRGRESR